MGMFNDNFNALSKELNDLGFTDSEKLLMAQLSKSFHNAIMSVLISLEPDKKKCTKMLLGIALCTKSTADLLMATQEGKMDIKDALRDVMDTFKTETEDTRSK